MSKVRNNMGLVSVPFLIWHLLIFMKKVFLYDQLRHPRWVILWIRSSTEKLIEMSIHLLISFTKCVRYGTWLKSEKISRKDSFFRMDAMVLFIALVKSDLHKWFIFILQNVIMITYILSWLSIRKWTLVGYFKIT